MNKIQSKKASFKQGMIKTAKTTANKTTAKNQLHNHTHNHTHDHSHSQHSNVPSSMIFQKKRYHGCLVCISGVVSERYTDPSRVVISSAFINLPF